MRSIHISLMAVFGVSISATAGAETEISGVYTCTVDQKAGISSIHLEGADPPRAYKLHGVQTTFGMRIDYSSDTDHPFVVIETEDRGEKPDRTQYHTNFSVLHGAYHGDGRDFAAADDQAFLRLHHQPSGKLFFYHAGFEYPGGEDVRLSVRFGQCAVRN